MKTKKEVFWIVVQLSLVGVMLITALFWGIIAILLILPIALIERFCLPSFNENTSVCES